MTSVVTKSLHQLPFDQLEPRRFEDLVRQLAYDFKVWRTLEATGKSGSDDGYDIRGWEIVADGADDADMQDEDDPDVVRDFPTDRRWLIQCKREGKIGPKRLKQFFDAIPATEKVGLYGLVFAVTCDLSKASRDAVRQRCREAGIAECHFWTRSEIEDMLYQPKNDGLLFAYFGISLRIKRRAIKSDLRSRLAMKRKLHRVFGSGEHLSETTLFLDPEDDDYPYLSEDGGFESVTWHPYDVQAHHPWGIEILLRKHFAYLSEDNQSWDMADAFDDAFDPWHYAWVNEEDRGVRGVLRREVWSAQDDFPEQCRGSLQVLALVSFDEILEVDKDGDSFFRGPIIYCSMKDKKPPILAARARIVTNTVFSKEVGANSIAVPSREFWLDDMSTGRVQKFPARFRKPAAN